MNLLEETLDVLTRNGKTPADVLWCGSVDFHFTWDDFACKAADTNYDSGYGGQEVACDLMVVGADWWLERHEYDGSEWWELKTSPVKPVTYCMPKRFTSPHNWESLSVMQQEEQEQEY